MQDEKRQKLLNEFKTLIMDRANEKFLLHLLKKSPNDQEWQSFLKILPRELRLAANGFPFVINLLINKLIPSSSDSLQQAKNTEDSLKELLDLGIDKISESQLKSENINDLKLLLNYYRNYSRWKQEERNKEVHILIDKRETHVPTKLSILARPFVSLVRGFVFPAPSLSEQISSKPYREDTTVKNILEEAVFQPDNFRNDLKSLILHVKGKLSEPDLSSEQIAQIYNWLDIRYRLVHAGEVFIDSECYDIKYSDQEEVHLDGVAISGFLSDEEKQNAEHVFYKVGNGECREDYYKRIVEEIRRAKDKGLNIIAHIYNERGVHKSNGEAVVADNLINDHQNIIQYHIEHKNISPERITTKGHSLGAAIATIATERLHKNAYPTHVFSGTSPKDTAAAVNKRVQDTGLFGFISGPLSFILRPLIRATGWLVPAAVSFEKIPEDHRHFLHRKGKKDSGQSDIILGLGTLKSATSLKQMRQKDKLMFCEIALELAKLSGVDQANIQKYEMNISKKAFNEIVNTMSNVSNLPSEKVEELFKPYQERLDQLSWHHLGKAWSTEGNLLDGLKELYKAVFKMNQFYAGNSKIKKIHNTPLHLLRSHADDKTDAHNYFIDTLLHKRAYNEAKQKIVAQRTPEVEVTVKTPEQPKVAQAQTKEATLSKPDDNKKADNVITRTALRARF